MEASRKKVVDLNIEDVLPNRFQPRIKFNEEAIVELSKSIKEHGVIQPIVVRPIGDKFEIIAGERRYKASCMAELKTIPAIITDLNDKDSAEVALIENVQRENLTPIEEAISYKKILDMGYITQDALATKLGKTQSTVANKLRLLNLDDEVQEALLNEKISERHARSLLKLTDKNQQREMLNKIIKERLTVRRADEEIEKILSGAPIEIQNDMENVSEQPLDNKTTDELKETPEQFRFINNIEIPVEQQEEIIPQEEKEELSPKKFFNILEEEEKTETKEDNNFNFENIFINPITDPAKSNSMMEELKEIENSINNSNTIPPISSEETETKEETEQQPEKEEVEELDFIEEEQEESTDENVEETGKIEDDNEDEKVTTLPERRIDNFKDVLEEIRTCGNKIEKAGFNIETEEIDLNGTYQVIFKIKND